MKLRSRWVLLVPCFVDDSKESSNDLLQEDENNSIVNWIYYLVLRWL